MQIAVVYDLIIHQMDVKSAYLNAPIDCVVYLDQPEGYTKIHKSGKKLVYKLNKSLYGLKQSGKNWNSLIHQFFLDNGCNQSNADPCVYTKIDKDGTLIYIVWVDDIIIAANSDIRMNYGKEILKKKFKMKDMGKISWFLGMQFCQEGGIVTMNQSYYLQNVLKRYGMDECKPRNTPCELKLSAYDDDSEITEELQYREVVVSFVYAMTGTRPDLSFIVTKLSQRLSNPGKGEWILIKQVLRYIKGTLDYKLSFSKSKNGLKLVAYSDSDWASSEDDRRSVTGYYFSLNEDGPAVSWKTRKQPTVALSTCEAEYMALSSTVQEAVYLNQVLVDLKQNSYEPILINEDNQGTIAMVKNPVKHNRSKHIDIKFHFIRDYLLRGKISVNYVQSENNIADLMTKPGTKVKLEKFKICLFGK